MSQENSTYGRGSYAFPMSHVLPPLSSQMLLWLSSEMDMGTDVAKNTNVAKKKNDVAKK